MKGLPVCCALFLPLHFCNARPFCLSQALDGAHFPGDFSACSGLLTVWHRFSFTVSEAQADVMCSGEREISHSRSQADAAFYEVFMSALSNSSKIVTFLGRKREVHRGRGRTEEAGLERRELAPAIG